MTGRGAIDAIVFDFDGVLADSERLHMRAFQAALAGEPVTLTDEAYYARYLGYDDGGVFRELFGDQGHALSSAELARLVGLKGRHFEALTATAEMLFPAAIEFVRTAAAVVPIAVASGALTHEIDHVLTRGGIRDLFVTVVGADQVRASKPAPDPYAEALARIQRHAGRTLDARRAVAIEDSRWGLASARAAGLRTVAVTTGYSAADLAPHAELVVSGLDALDMGMLQRLCESAA